MFITKIEEHEEYKERLLSLIDEMPESSYETVTKTDWNVPQEIPREYLKLFYQEILYGKDQEHKTRYRTSVYAYDEEGYIKQ